MVLRACDIDLKKSIITVEYHYFNPIPTFIYTNEFNNICSGLLINDITDHISVFAICKYQYIKITSAPKYKYV